MKNEFVRTGLFVAAAIVAIGAANYIEPEAAKSEIFSDTGETFFPEFRDVMAVKAIEVVDYDEADAVARPLKVEFRKNRWVLTSHSDYPAEAKDRMAKTAAALIDLKKDQAVSDRWEDHAGYGVIDPLDTKNPSLQGRGKRITLKDAGNTTLAELIIGKAAPNKAGYRYVRLPGQKRTYAIKTEVDASARFEDWVESNLLRATPADIVKMTLNAYQIDEQFGRLVNLQRTVMEKDKPSWNDQARTTAAALASLRVVGARPKPPQLAEQLKTGQLALTLETVMSLRQRGFHITPNGQLLSNEGELGVETAQGLIYTLRFGEVVSDSTAVSAASVAKPRENRYLFVTVGAKNPDKEPQAKALTAKFADWYYVISGADFAKLHPGRREQSKVVAPPGLPPGFPAEMMQRERPQAMPGQPGMQGPARPPVQGPALPPGAAPRPQPQD
ncbi:MAG: DUF4340 domain-containing protein [Bryobacterales bacterium]|nr:DUF4340 domain-containing protein [Bryobacterales bacterium]